jgi:predicted signal transduction protein with EAL and GGDEF domain
VYPDDGEDAEVLLQKANTAMYRSKGLGRNTFHVYSAQMSQQHRHKLVLLAALRRAVDHQELLLHYQPRVDLGNCCSPALRWISPHCTPPGWTAPILNPAAVHELVSVTMYSTRWLGKDAISTE